MIPLSRIFLSSSKLVADNIGDMEKKAFDFKLNQIVNAKVIQNISPRKALLLVDDKNITAKISTPLTPGESVLLKVVKTGQQPVFRLVDPEEKDLLQQYRMVVKSMDKAGPYRHLLSLVRVPDETVKSGDAAGIQQLSEKMGQLLSSSVPASENPDHANLIRLIQDSSLSGDNKLRSLMALGRVFSKDHTENTIKNDMKMFAGELLKYVEGKNETAEKVIRMFLETLDDVPDDPGKGDYAGRLGKLAGKMGTLLSSPMPASEIPDRRILSSLIQNSRLSWENKLRSLMASNRIFIKDHTENGLKSDLKTFAKELLADVSGKNETAGKTIRTFLDLLDKVLDDPWKGDDTGRIRQLSGKMEKLLASTALDSEIPDRRILSRVIQNSGLSWENKLQGLISSNRVFLKGHTENLMEKDLKALATELLTHIKGKNETVEKGLHLFLDHLDALQVLNRYTLEESGRFLLHLPVLFENQFKFGQMLIDLNTRNRVDKDSHNSMIRIAFLLELTNLGDFLADFSILKNAVTGSFGVANDSIRVFIEDHIPELVSKLNNNGFTVQRIDCRVINPEEFSGTSLSDRLMDGYDGVLNLVI